MEQQINFLIEKTYDNKTRFLTDKITITVDDFSVTDGKHCIANPQRARAHVSCGGMLYLVSNTGLIPTVEEWYSDELLPKLRLLDLLDTPDLL